MRQMRACASPATRKRQVVNEVPSISFWRAHVSAKVTKTGILNSQLYYYSYGN